MRDLIPSVMRMGAYPMLDADGLLATMTTNSEATGLHASPTQISRRSQAMSSDTPLTNGTKQRFFSDSDSEESGWMVPMDFARQLETELAEARQQLETERMRLAACSTAALGYFTDCLPEYRSAALEDVLQLRQQLVEQDALVERMQSVIEDLEVYAACFIEGTTPKISIENAREDFADAEAVISFTPSSALSEHDAEVRRKVLVETISFMAAVLGLVF